MSKFIKLTRYVTNKDALVNTDNIDMISSDVGSGVVFIRFISGEVNEFTESYDDVVSLISSVGE